MKTNFRALELAKTLYKQCNSLSLKGEIRDQLQRASLSVCLNLAEGSAKDSPKDRRRFYVIALGSLREVQTIIDIESLPLMKEADILGAHIYKLTRSLG
jgi:hypothetical protein